MACDSCSALFFSAHPDDAEFAAGGTFLKMAKHCSVVNAILTKGEAGTFGSPEQREKEAMSAAEFAGARVEFLGFRDNHVENTVENAKKLASVIRKHKPQVIFAPYHNNVYSHRDGMAHPDHVSLGKMVRAAARFAKFRNAELGGESHMAESIVYYMVPKYVKPSFVVDVSDAVEEMKALWKRHGSQMQLREGRIEESLLGFRRAVGNANSLDYAEAFIVEEPLKLNSEDILGI